MNIADRYEYDVKPVQLENKKWINTRATKDTRYTNYLIHKQVELSEKERWAIDILKMALKRSDKPILACSFGIDSIIALYLTRIALKELGRSHHDLRVVWCDTANEFQDVREYQKRITKEWDLNLIVMKPKKTLKHIINAHGGVTDDYFTARKGDRTIKGTKGTRPLSEKCCGTLKHEPMKRFLKENKGDLIIVGTRADESMVRFQTGLRDGEYFYSTKEWKSFVCRPIIVTGKQIGRAHV